MSAAATLPPAALPKLGSLLRLLGSDRDGEALGAARAIGRVLAGFGLTVHDLAEAVERSTESPRADTEVSAQHRRKARHGVVMLNAKQRAAATVALHHALGGARLSTWEREFAHGILDQLRMGCNRLSERQNEALRRLLDKIGEGSAWA